MIVSRRKRADRFSAVALLILAAGAGSAGWLGLRPQAPAGLPQAAGAAQPARSADPLAPASAENLSILWRGAPEASATSPELDASPSTPAAASVPAGEQVPFAVRGIIASLTGSSSAVFVQLSSGDCVVRLGEDVAGWKLTGVTANAATFTRDGREVALNLANREYETGSAATRAYAAAEPPQASPPVPEANARSPRAIAQRAAESRGPASASTVSSNTPSAPPPRPDGADAVVALPRDVYDAGRADPTAAMQGIKAEPYMRDGKMQGLTIAGMAGDSLAAKCGFAPGDHIIAVNGTPIDSVSHAMSIYQQCRDNTSVTVTIERGGQRKNVVYYVQ